MELEGQRDVGLQNQLRLHHHLLLGLNRHRVFLHRSDKESIDLLFRNPLADAHPFSVREWQRSVRVDGPVGAVSVPTLRQEVVRSTKVVLVSANQNVETQRHGICRIDTKSHESLKCFVQSLGYGQNQSGQELEPWTVAWLCGCEMYSNKTA